MLLFNKLATQKDKTVHLNYGREIIKQWALAYAGGLADRPRLLDIGCGGQGGDGLGIKRSLEASGRACELHGIETNPAYIKQASALGLTIASANLEIDRLPYDDASFDIVIANQILEHVKEFFWINSEINRVLKTGGLYIIGVPNLASWHNRLLLLFGRQPTSIRTLGPHVRGFTNQDLTSALSAYGGYRLRHFAGSNFYPLPAWLANIFSRLFPSAAVSIFLALEKKGPARFDEFLAEPLETNFRI